ncbi:MAG: cytochrome c3 family protein [bacterium]
MMKLLTIPFLLILIAITVDDFGSPVDPGEKKCLDCHAAILQESYKHQPVTINCSACHHPTGKPHPGGKEKGFRLEKEIPQLCYTCHEVKNNKRNVHPPAQRGKCMSCHTPHSSPQPGLLIMYPVATLCQECHDLDMTGKKSRHQAVADGNCMNCHEPHQSDFKMLVKSDRPTLCTSCHENIKALTSLKTVHPPFERNCLICHSGHSSDEAHLVTLKTKELCYGCHEDVQADLQDLQRVHPPTAADSSCFTCHSPHASANKKLLISEEKKLCLSCHGKPAGTETKNAPDVAQTIRNSKFLHGAMEKEGCSGCHRPHASKNRDLLSSCFSPDFYTVASKDTLALCFNCHKPELIEQPITSFSTGFRNGQTNLHYVHVQGDKARNCTVCHNVHGAQNKFLIVDKIRFGDWQMPMRFTFSESGGSCSPGCHGEKHYRR